MALKGLEGSKKDDITVTRPTAALGGLDSCQDSTTSRAERDRERETGLLVDP